MGGSKKGMCVGGRGQAGVECGLVCVPDGHQCVSW